jgi:hypothetical protein
MNTILFYGGLFIAGIAFLIALFLFFYYRIPTVIGYLSRMKGNSVGSNRTSSLTTARLSSTTTRTSSAMTTKQTSRFASSGDLTEILVEQTEEETEILYGDEVTAILGQSEDDKTEIL